MLTLRRNQAKACRIVHELPGRVRVHCPGLRLLAGEADALGGKLRALPGVRCVEVSAITENVLVRFERTEAQSGDILTAAQSILSHYALTAFKAERALAVQSTVQERRLQEDVVGGLLTRVLASVATLAFTALTTRAVPATLLGRFLTIPALAALSLAWPIFRSGVSSLARSGRPNADTLSATAIVASLVSGRGGAALTIIALADLAELLTAYTMRRTRRAIRDMLSVGEAYVWRLEADNREVRVPIEQVRVADRIVVKTGEKISVDGAVEDGEAAVDQASITGEFMPMRKQTGDQVFAGTVVTAGRLTISARRVGDQTAVSRIVHLVEEAARRKATVQAFADRFSTQLIPANFGLAGLVYAVTGIPERALNMLIIDYSCGVRLSTATAFSAAIATAARNGVLIKGSNYLEMLAEADTIVLDKTGTVTKGRPQITSMVPLAGGMSERALTELAAAAEETSTHPIAMAFGDTLSRNGWSIPPHGPTDVTIGRGVTTTVSGIAVFVGSASFMRERAIDLSGADESARELTRRGEQVVYVARGRTIVGVLGIQDTLRDDMKKSLNRLRMLGFDDIILLTGDVRQHAELVATKMAMDRYQAQVLPEEKSDVVLGLQQKGSRVVMVGDGINDAAALACADVGIALGGMRTDIAMEAADITITSDDPLLIPATARLSQKTMRIVKQNFATAIGVNTAALVLALLGRVPVVWGAAVHNATTVLVVLNSLRLLLHRMKRRR